MAILCLDLELERRAGQGLHEFLNGGWALLFSHPQDFHPGRQSDGERGSSDFELLRNGLKVRQVRPMLVKRDSGSADPSWIGSMGEQGRLVHLKEPPFNAADAVSFGARQLRGELLTRGEGFVLIVDEALRRRGVYKYPAGRNDLSAHDLLASVDALRRPAVGRAA
jgi:alkyl hydroperoxide reductase subunit AhpC